MANPPGEGPLAEIEELCREAQALSAAEPARALRAAERARRLAEAAGDPLPLARALLVLGRVHLAQAEHAAAEETFLLALQPAREASADGLTVDSLAGLLKCAFFTQRPDEALTRGMQALHLAERVGDDARTAVAHNDLGLVYGVLGDFEGSLDHLLAGQRLLRARGGGEDGSVLNNIGNVYLELSDERQALTFYEGALDAFAAGGSARQQGIALGNIGRARARLGEHGAALDAFRASLERFETHEGDRVYLAPALARLGAAFAAVGDDAAARACLQRALAAAEATGQREFLDEVLAAAGRFHLERGEAREAVPLLRRALETVPPDETTPRLAELHRSLADAHERAGDLAAALHHLRAHQRVARALSDASASIRIRKLMVEFDVERARQQEEIFRLRNVELARANEELRALHAELEARNRELHRVSIEDALTGVFNRRWLDLQLPGEISRARRRGRALSVAMCDIDHFKAINDRFSHAVGDDVLRHLGRLFLAATREEDLVCRYGGEEFLLVMPETDLAGAHRLVERLRASVAEQPWERMHPGLRVTLSVGLAQADPGEGAEELLARADARLYWAKRNGRNRIGNRQ